MLQFPKLCSYTIMTVLVQYSFPLFLVIRIYWKIYIFLKVKVKLKMLYICFISLLCRTK